MRECDQPQKTLSCLRFFQYQPSANGTFAAPLFSKITAPLLKQKSPQSTMPSKSTVLFKNVPVLPSFSGIFNIYNVVSYVYTRVSCVYTRVVKTNTHVSCVHTRIVKTNVRIVKTNTAISDRHDRPIRVPPQSKCRMAGKNSPHYRSIYRNVRLHLGDAGMGTADDAPRARPGAIRRLNFCQKQTCSDFFSHLFTTFAASFF